MIDDAAVEAALRRCFADLPDDELEALKTSCGYLAGWIDCLPRDLSHRDEPIHIFSPAPQPR